jgi:hypothetical protein
MTNYSSVHAVQGRLMTPIDRLLCLHDFGLRDTYPISDGDLKKLLEGRTNGQRFLMTIASAIASAPSEALAATVADRVLLGLRDQRREETSRRKPRSLPDGGEILSPDDVAGILSIPTKTVIALCAQGRLQGSFKAGRRWRIPGLTVRKFVGLSDRTT